jgi:hypothetical protein
MDQPLTLHGLMLNVGRRLVGQPVELQYTKRSRLKSGGCCRVNPKGKIIIDLADGLPTLDDGNLMIFLHELAHARLHSQKFGRSDTDQAPDWNTYQDEGQKNKAIAARRALMELQADTLARSWANWAERHAKTILDNGRSNLENRLVALLRY